MADIHPTAIIERGAELAADVSVGPYSIIGAQVRLGAGCVIGPHVVITGDTVLGPNNRVFQFASIGDANQDKKYRGEPTRVEIGAGNTFREGVTIHRGTVQDVGVTRIGDDNWLMAYSHVAHDCQVGSHTIVANAVQLAGHVELGDWAIVGGLTGIHQFVTIGAHAFVGAATYLSQDVPPFVMASGNPAAARGINSEGLKRRGFSAEAIAAVKRAYKTLYRDGLSLADARTRIESEAANAAELAPFVAFFAQATRGIVR